MRECMNAIMKEKETEKEKGLCGWTPFRAGVRGGMHEWKERQGAEGKERRAKNKEMNEMEHNGLNRGLRSNPADLHVYRKKQYPENTTPAGVGQSIDVLYFWMKEKRIKKFEL